jgi:hypothetical protein
MLLHDKRNALIKATVKTYKKAPILYIHASHSDVCMRDMV